MLVVDRGYYNQESLIKLGQEGYHFLAGAQTGYRLVKTIIEDRDNEFYEAVAILESTNAYGIQEQKVQEGQAGKLDVKVSVFRNPLKSWKQRAVY